MASFDPTQLNGIGLVRLAIVRYRNQAPGFDARSGEGARRFGGRYNPPRSFPVIYLCLTKPCVAAELRGRAVRQGVQIEDPSAEANHHPAFHVVAGPNVQGPTRRRRSTGRRIMSTAPLGGRHA